MKYVLGTDNGGTVTKAALFDSVGNEIAGAARETELRTYPDGRHERDARAMWQATAACIREVMEKSGVNPHDVLGVGCTGHGKGLYLIGKDGEPLEPAIASTDVRAAEIVARWEADGTSDAAEEIALQRPIPCQPAALLRWLKQNDVKTYGAIRWVLEAKDYVRYCLTGEARAERTDNSGTALMNLREERFDERLTALYGISEMDACLPQLCSSTDLCGYVTPKAAAETGLAAGTPVCGGMFDIDACALAAGVVEGGTVCAVSGTWSINEFICDAPLGRDGTKNSLFCLPGKYLIEESSPTSAGNLEWFLRECTGGMGYAEADRMAENTIPREDDPYFLPFLYGNFGKGQGAFLGLCEYHTKAQLLRSVYEGVVLGHRWHIERLLRFCPNPERIRLTGGAARVPVWAQMFADYIGIPVECVRQKQLGAAGAAMAAAVAAGLYGNLSEAANAMVQPDRQYLPNRELTAFCDRRFAEFKSYLPK